MYVADPVILSYHEIWIFCRYDDAGEWDTFRLAINAYTGEYFPIPPKQFVMDALIPIRKDDRSPFGNFIWATYDDLQANPQFPGWRYTQRPT